MRRFLFGALFLGLALACAAPASDEDSDDERERPPRDTDADTDEADDIPDVCREYLACVAAVDAEALAALQGTYGEGGSCWEDAETAEICEVACETGLQDVAEQNPDVEACAAGLPDGPDGTWYLEQTRGSGTCSSQAYSAWLYDTVLVFSPDGARYDVEGVTDLHLGTSPFSIELRWEDCRYSGGTITCPETYDDGIHSILWELGGVYVDGRVELQVRVTVTDGRGAEICADDVELRGER